MRTVIRRRNLAFALASTIAACGEPIEAPRPSTGVRGGAGSSELGRASPLFRPELVIRTRQDFARLMGLIACTFEIPCCPQQPLVCFDAYRGGGFESALEKAFPDAETAFRPDVALACATSLVQRLQAFVESGACERDLEAFNDEFDPGTLSVMLERTLAARTGGFGAFLDERPFSHWLALRAAGLPPQEFVDDLIACADSAFVGKVDVGGSCGTVDEEGTPDSNDRVCADGLYCFETWGEPTVTPVCRKRTPLGERCDSTQSGRDCPKDARCAPVEETEVCAPLGAVGERCREDDAVCADYLTCIDGVCEASQGALGAPCRTGTDCASGRCDERLLVCKATAGPGEGADCPVLDRGMSCSDGTFCDRPRGEFRESRGCIRPTLKSGSPCASDADCLSLACTGVCARTLADYMCSVSDLTPDSSGSALSSASTSFLGANPALFRPDRRPR